MITYKGKDVKLNLIQTELDYRIVITDRRSGNRRFYCRLSSLSDITKEFEALVKLDKAGEFKWDEEV